MRELIRFGFIKGTPAELADLRVRFVFRGGNKMAKFTPEKLSQFMREKRYEAARDEFFSDVAHAEFVLNREGEDESLDFEVNPDDFSEFES